MAHQHMERCSTSLAIRGRKAKPQEVPLHAHHGRVPTSQPTPARAWDVGPRAWLFGHGGKELGVCPEGYMKTHPWPRASWANTRMQVQTVDPLEMHTGVHGAAHKSQAPFSRWVHKRNAVHPLDGTISGRKDE